MNKGREVISWLLHLGVSYPHGFEEVRNHRWLDLMFCLQARQRIEENRRGLVEGSFPLPRLDLGFTQVILDDPSRGSIRLADDDITEPDVPVLIGVIAPPIPTSKPTLI